MDSARGSRSVSSRPELSEELGDHLRDALGGSGFNAPWLALCAQLVDQGVGQYLRGGAVEIHAAAGSVAIEPRPHVELLFAVVTEGK